jgi:glycosyltransferase involved in cell wall biosynthesis
LSRLIRAWSEVGKRHQNWSLVLAGPDEAGHRKEIESLAAQLHCQDRLIFTGELDESNKWIALNSASLFVMPSDFENFGSSIVEAMACGVPVITTTGTPWKELPKADAGWCVEPDPGALSWALQEALSKPIDALQHMGLRAAAIATKYRPGEKRTNLSAVYDWLSRTAAKPSCVIEA